MEIRHVGILHHPRKPESLRLAADIASYLEVRGIKAWLGSAWDEAGVSQEMQALDMIISLGGDGTILRAARMASSYGVPILGVRMGRVGFLAEVDPMDWEGPLSRIISGDFWLEVRMMLQTYFVRDGERSGATYEALNDVVVSRGSLARIVRIHTYLDDAYLTTYAADGLIVSTATGSTGYSLAVGGPILPPELKNILLIPIAAHLSLNRAVVLSQGTMVRMQVFSDHQIILTVDGQFEVELQNGDEVVVGVSPHVARFVRTQDRGYFYRTLMERLKWQV